MATKCGFPGGGDVVFSPSTVSFLICQMPTGLHLQFIRYSTGSISSIGVSIFTVTVGAIFIMAEDWGHLQLGKWLCSASSVSAVVAWTVTSYHHQLVPS